MTTGLGIKDVAEQTQISAGTIRIWEQRYGWPTPERTAGGYRRYSEDDVAALRRVVAYRRRGLSLPAALERAREQGTSSDRPSIYAAVWAEDPGVAAHRLRKSSLLAMSRAIEDETLAHAARPVCFGAFQEERFYRAVEHRYRRLAELGDAAVVFADFAAVRDVPGEPVEVPIEPDAALGNEWAVIVDAPGYAACLLAWEQPERDRGGAGHDPDRRFEALWTIDPGVVRRASRVATRLAGRADPELGRRLERALEDRPLAAESPAPALTSLTNRMVGYLED